MTPVTSLVVSKPGSEELAFLQEDASDLLDETGAPHCSLPIIPITLYLRATLAIPKTEMTALAFFKKTNEKPHKTLKMNDC